jgi:hypothetical protein
VVLMADEWALRFLQSRNPDLELSNKPFPVVG